MKKNYFFVLFFISIICIGNAQSVMPDSNGVIYVKKGETGNGSSWNNATGELAPALKAAKLLNDGSEGTVTQIWVTGGTYYPMYRADNLNSNDLTNKNNAFVLVNNVQVYGSFAGTETILEERDLSITANESILSGDFNDNDTYTTTSYLNNNTASSENAYHVVIASGHYSDVLADTTILDGFTIKSGNATSGSSITVNSNTFYDNRGGGLAVYNSMATFSNLKITQNRSSAYGGGLYIFGNTSFSFSFHNVIISYNHSDSDGGGIYGSGGWPIVSNTFVHHNRTYQRGGGAYFTSSRFTINSSEFSYNTASESAAGIYNSNSNYAKLNDVIISHNSLTTSGSTLLGAGMCNIFSNKTSLNNVTITNNSGSISGGGIFNNSSSIALTNCNISDNAVTSKGGGIYTQGSNTQTNVNGSTIQIDNTVISGNTSDFQGGGIYITNVAIGDVLISNSAIINNTAQSTSPVNFIQGGGIYAEDADLIITNVTLANNTSSKFGGGIALTGTSTNKIRNSIIFGNTATSITSYQNVYKSTGTTINYYNSLIEGTIAGWTAFGNDAGGNIDTDPQFTDAVNGDYSLQESSEAIDAGSNTYYEAGQTPDLSEITTDVAGNDRFYNGGIVDMGAYEYQGSLNTIEPDINGILYVKKGETGNGSGWNDALGEMGDALKAAKELNEDTAGTVNQIWVAGGTYYPMYRADNLDGSNPTDRYNAFVLVPDVQLYGGFAGTETTIEERNLLLVENASILSGDFNEDDTEVFITYGENAYHLIIASGDLGESIIDGFTVSSGNGESNDTILVNGNVINNNIGAGVYIEQSASAISNVTVTSNKSSNSGAGLYSNVSDYLSITNSVFSNNFTINNGGAIYNISSVLDITDTEFTGNEAKYGGAIHTNSSELLISNTSFEGNIASGMDGAAAIYNIQTELHIDNSIFNENIATPGNIVYINSSAGTDSTPISLNNVTFQENTVANKGTLSVYNVNPDIKNVVFIDNTGGSAGLYNYNSNPIITNSLFAGNTNNSFGTIYNYNSNPILTNVTIANNTAENGAAIYNYSYSNPLVRNSIIWNNTSTGASINSIINEADCTTSFINSLIEGSGGSNSWDSSFGVDAGNNIDVNPLFSDSENSDYTLQDLSPAISAGNAVFYESGQIPLLTMITTDLAGNERINGIIDMGAYESDVCAVAPIAESQTLCFGSTVADLEATGNNLQWYSSETEDNVLADTEILDTGIYYVSQTVGVCESTRIAVNVTVNTTPAPTAESQTFCNGATVAELEATGTDLQWYTSETSEDVLAETEILEIGIYYVSQTLNSCESERTAVTVTVNITPVPTAESQTFCNGATVAELEATGTDLQWYTSETSEDVLAETEILETGTYYVSQTLNTCESERTEVTVTVNTTPAPIAEAQTFCNGATVAELEATGTDLLWYVSETAISPLAEASLLETGTYYVSQTLNGCESARTEVIITINTTPIPTAEAQTFCNGATVAELEATGTDLQWYTSETSEDVLAETEILETGIYYVSQTLNTCESERTEVTVTVNTTPAPTAESQTFCNGATVAELEATGTDLQWYTSETSDDILAETTLLETGTYYVSQSLNSCESARTAVTVTVNTTSVPIAESQTFCNGATVVELEATGTDLLWYVSETAISPLAETTLLETGTYYVSQTLNTCESERTEVTVTVNTTPAPTAEAQTFCNGATIAELEAIGTDLQWYTSETSEDVLAETEILETGTYYVSQTLNSCENARIEVMITVNTTPAPEGDTVQEISVEDGENATIADLEVTGNNVMWYATEEDALSGGEPLAEDTVLTSGSTYYAIQTVDGCSSDITLPVTVSVVAGIKDIAFSEEIKLHPNPTESVLTIESQNNINKILIYNLIGQLVFERNYNSNIITVDISELEGATYIISIQAGETFSNKKIIKRN